MNNIQLKAQRIVAIIRGVEPSDVLDIGRALIDAGIRVIEVPLNSPDPYTSIETLSHAYADTALIGAGTVLDTGQVERVFAAGGRLVVSPNTNRQVIEKTKELGMISLPGFATATEAFTAISAGADGLKLFPCTEEGASVIKALKAVLPETIPVFAVGGVDTGNMGTLAEAGADGFGLGGSLYRPAATADDVSKRAARLVQACQQAYG